MAHILGQTEARSQQRGASLTSPMWVLESKYLSHLLMLSQGHQQGTISEKLETISCGGLTHYTTMLAHVLFHLCYQFIQKLNSHQLYQSHRAPNYITAGLGYGSGPRTVILDSPPASPTLTTKPMPNHSPEQPF